MNKKNRVLLLLAAYDYESLHLTLESLSHTLENDERVVVILNGKRGIRSAVVEDVARAWSAGSPNRVIIKPLNYGLDAYTSISEVIQKLPIIQSAEFICKIDDDLIPLKKGWVDSLHQAYLDLEKKEGPIGFVTSLINNNPWGFKQLVYLYDKDEEYQQIMNFESLSGTGRVPAGQIADGRLGTVWQYPYLAKWVHSWTMLDIPQFINKTANEGIKEVGLDLHYSIGCMFFRKELWTSLHLLESDSNFDELLIHEYCQKNRLRKFAVMNEPMGHLFFYVQRLPNRLMMPQIKESLAAYWQDDRFAYDFKFDATTTHELVLEGYMTETADKLLVLQNKLDVVYKSSFYYKIKNFYRLVRGQAKQKKKTSSEVLHHPAAGPASVKLSNHRNPSLTP